MPERERERERETERERERKDRNMFGVLDPGTCVPGYLINSPARPYRWSQ